MHDKPKEVGSFGSLNPSTGTPASYCEKRGGAKPSSDYNDDALYYVPVCGYVHAVSALEGSGMTELKIALSTVARDEENSVKAAKLGGW